MFGFFKRKKKIIWRCERSFWAFWHEDWSFKRVDNQFTLRTHNQGDLSAPLHTLKVSVSDSAIWSTMHVSFETDYNDTPKTFILKGVRQEDARRIQQIVGEAIDAHAELKLEQAVQKEDVLSCIRTYQKQVFTVARTLFRSIGLPKSPTPSLIHSGL